MLFRLIRGFEVGRGVVRPSTRLSHARLTTLGRESLIRQHLDEGRSLAQLAAEQGISESTARKWLARLLP
jgi:transposase-like protein